MSYLKKIEAKSSTSAYTKKLKEAAMALKAWDKKHYGVYADAHNDKANLGLLDKQLLNSIDGMLRSLLGQD